MKVIDNFLDSKDFKYIKDHFSENKFPWYWQEKSSIYENDFWQFSHNLYQNGKEIGSLSFPVIIPLLKKIQMSALGRAKINCNPQTEKIIETGYHNDENDSRFYSSVFFLNTCDGYCKVGDKKIFSEENRLLTFKSDIIHTGSTTTNAKRRLVISVIYLPVL